MQITLPRIAKIAAAVAIGFSAVATQAATLAMNGWLFPGGSKTVDSVTGISNPSTYKGEAGGFTGTLSGFLPSTNPFNISPVEMYCVDLGEFIDINKKNYTVKIDGESGSTDFTIMAVGDVFSDSVAERLGRLVSYAESDQAIVNSSTRSTAMQLAIWNTIYDFGDDGNDQVTNGLGAGTFYDKSSHAAYANTLLANSASWSITKELYVLRSVGNPGKQDQLFWIDTPTDVPEPASLALVGLALAGVAASRRRKA